VKILKQTTIVIFVLTFAAVHHALAANREGKSETSLASALQMSMPLVAPLWIQNSEFTSTLVLVNAADARVYADVSVRGLDGVLIASKRINFSPKSQRLVDVGSLLNASNSSATVGSITVMTSSGRQGSVAAALSMTYLTSPRPNYIDEELAMPSMTGSQVLRGVANPGTGSPAVAITSLVESTQHIQINCFSQAGSRVSKNVELKAGQTVLTSSCGDEPIDSADPAAVFKTMNLPAHRSMGIELRSDAMPGSFAAFALMPHRQRNEQFFSSVPFTDPKMVMSGTTAFPAVPVGSSPSLSVGTFVPQVSLANFSAKGRNVRIVYSRTSGPMLEVRTVKTIVVPAMSSTSVSLIGLEGDPQITNSFVAISDAAPGELMTKLVAKSDSVLHQVEVLGKDEMGVENAGNHPWSLRQGTESVLFLFNPGSEVQPFTVIVSTGNTVGWRKKYELKPMETTAIDIRRLLQDQLPDDSKTTLPPDALYGEVTWISPGKNPGMGRILQSNSDAAMARSFSCTYTSAPCSPATVDVAPSQIPLGGTGLADFNYSICAVPQGQSGCGSHVTNNGSGFPTHWNSGGPISVKPTGTPGEEINADITGNAAGSGSVSAAVAGNGCGTGAGASVPVNPADHFSVMSDSGSIGPGQLACPTGTKSIFAVRQMTMQGVDVNDNTIAVNFNIAEAYAPTQPANSCPAHSPQPPGCASTGIPAPLGPGQFQDILAPGPAYNIGNFCYPSGTTPYPKGCGFSETATWSLCGSSGSNSLWVSPRTTHSDVITVDGNSGQWTKNTQCGKNGC
jgi:hypothetical protein